MLSQPVTHTSHPQGLCAPVDTPCGKTLLVALGIILMVGGLVATGCFYQSIGSIAFAYTGAGFVLGSIPILIATCKTGKREPVERFVIQLSYDGTVSPARERATKLGHTLGMSDYSTVSTEYVSLVQLGSFEKHRERSIGIMLGMAVGDAVGAPFEFLPFKPEGYVEGEEHDRFNLLPGQWTDDASMGLCLADMLIAGAGELNETQLLWSFYDWWNHGYNNAFTDGAYRSSVGLGGNIGQTLNRVDERHLSRDDLEESRPTTAGDRFTSGNGSLMRNGPVAIAAHFVEEARALAARQSKVTHQGDEAAACCELMAFIMYHAIHDESESPEEIKANIIDALEDFECTQLSVAALAKRAEAENPQTYALENWSWLDPDFSFNLQRLRDQPGYIGSYAMDGLAMALHYVFTTDSFEAAIRKAAMRGGDADTVGAITGQIAGAIYGRNGIPQQWIEQVQQWDRGGEIAARGYLLSEHG